MTDSWVLGEDKGWMGVVLLASDRKEKIMKGSGWVVEVWKTVMYDSMDCIVTWKLL